MSEGQTRLDRFIVGEHPRIGEARRRTEQAGHLRILFTGETGVGKTPFAQYSNALLAERENRARPFEQINCACLTGDHFTDELFGHRRGAFTGAVGDRVGYVELADGGDLFLDEIGELSPDLQARLLTFLDHQTFYRLGDDRKRHVKVRVISATNRDLPRMVAEGRFRQDLYSRLSQVVVLLPPLRERVSDIPRLFSHFGMPFGISAQDCEPALMDRLCRYDWREGNVRELRDTVAYLATVAGDRRPLTPDLLYDRYAPASSPNPSSDEIPWAKAYELGLDRFLLSVEAQLLTRGLRQFRDAPHAVEALAQELKMSRSTLYRKLKRHGVTYPRPFSAGLAS